MYEGFRCFLFCVLCLLLLIFSFGHFCIVIPSRMGVEWVWNLFTRKMFVTYRAAAGQAARIVDRKVWQLHEALPWPERPKEFDDGVRYDVDVNEVKQLPLLQLIGACS